MECVPVLECSSAASQRSRKCSSSKRLSTPRLINAAFILPRRAKMEAVQKECWYLVVLLSLPFLQVSVQGLVRLEEGMVLDCRCPWEGNLSMVSWTKAPQKSLVAVFHPEYGVDFPPLYRDRVDFLRRTPMDGSISMRNVTHRDIGVYRCSVQTFPQGPWTRTVQVEDLDEPPEDDDATESPPPPEVTAADRELLAEHNANLTISCNHLHNGSVYQVVLERMLRGGPWDIIGVCKKVDGGLVSEDYSDRGRVHCQDSLDVSLQLTQVGQGDTGFYRCTFNTDSGVQITTVQLSVAAAADTTDGFSLASYMMYIYVGAAAGLLLVAVILILAVRRRARSRREEYRVKLHPSQRQTHASLQSCET